MIKEERKGTWTEERPSDWTVYSFLLPHQHCEDVRKTSNVRILFFSLSLTSSSSVILSDDAD